MEISALREQVGDAFVGFAWDQWGQMGLLARPDHWDPWTMDPEALLVFSLEVARRDPRLCDELLDWLYTNERIVSVQRLRNLAVDDADRSLVDASLSWVAQRKRRLRERTRGDAVESSTAADLVPLFHDLPTRSVALDPAFAEHGFAKPDTVASDRSQAPDLGKPINFAFRLRHLLGVSARAEVMRWLLSSGVPRVSAPVIARSAGYSKRNVQGALTALVAAGVIQMIVVGGEQSYRTERDRWGALLKESHESWPRHVDWPQLLGASLRILRWLDDPATESLSDYMRASEARNLTERIAGDLRYAGIMVETGGQGGPEEGWEAFVATVHHLLVALGHRR